MNAEVVSRILEDTDDHLKRELFSIEKKSPKEKTFEEEQRAEFIFNQLLWRIKNHYHIRSEQNV